MTYLILFVASACLGLALVAQPATATHYFGATGQQGCTAGNSPQVKATQYYYYDALQSESSAAVTWNRTNNVNPTQMNTALQSAYNSSTDVWVGDRYYDDYCGYDWYQGPGNGGSTVGVGNCARTISGGRCDQHDLRLNNHFTDNTTTTNIRGLACHEGGHVLGLGHRASSASSCMPTGYPKPALAYDDHDRTGINLNN